jgi:hypothetical protein
MAFEKEQFEAAGGEWEMAAYCNRILDEVSTSRVAAIQHADYIRSKIAWKYAVLRQSLTYRTVDLIDATMAIWSSKRWLSSLVAGRAAIETVALVHEIEQQMRKLIDAKDIPGLDDFAMKQLYSAKAEDYLLDPKFVTKSILSAVDRLDKEIPALRQYYDTLSEYAHPNAKGHHLFFGRLDEEKRVNLFWGNDRPSRYCPARDISMPWNHLGTVELQQYG